MRKAALSLVISTLAANAAIGQVTDYALFKEGVFTSTDAGGSTPTGWFLDARIFENPGDSTAASFTNANGVTDAMSLISPGTFDFSPGLGTKSAMDAASPDGSVSTFRISGGNLGSDSGVFTSPSTPLYPSTVPTFTDFNAIQNLNANQAFTFTINGFAPLTGAADASYLFLSVSDAAGTVFSQDYLPATTTSILMPADTLAAGQKYFVSLDYENLASTIDNGFVASSGGVNPTAGYDYQTSMLFTAGVPELPTWLLIATGVALLILTGKSQIRQQ